MRVVSWAKATNNNSNNSAQWHSTLTWTALCRPLLLSVKEKDIITGCNSLAVLEAGKGKSLHEEEKDNRFFELHGRWRHSHFPFWAILLHRNLGGYWHFRALKAALPVFQGCITFPKQQFIYFLLFFVRSKNTTGGETRLPRAAR